MILVIYGCKLSVILYCFRVRVSHHPPPALHVNGFRFIFMVNLSSS
jgi:hypothetical protein